MEFSPRGNPRPLKAAVAARGEGTNQTADYGRSAGAIMATNNAAAPRNVPKGSS